MLCQASVMVWIIVLAADAFNGSGKCSVTGAVFAQNHGVWLHKCSPEIQHFCTVSPLLTQGRAPHAPESWLLGERECRAVRAAGAV